MNTIINNTEREMPNLLFVVDKFVKFAQNRMSFDKPVEVELISDSENGQILLGKTAYYDRNNFKVCVFVDNRHPKDILRSLSHELMHHAQNCRGDFNNIGHLDDGYAQDNEHMRDLEIEAYEAAIILRDFEDSIEKEEKNQITLDEWKNREIFHCLMERFVPRKAALALVENRITKNQPTLREKFNNIMSDRMKNNR